VLNRTRCQTAIVKAFGGISPPTTLSSPDFLAAASHLSILDTTFARGGVYSTNKLAVISTPIKPGVVLVTVADTNLVSALNHQTWDSAAHRKTVEVVYKRLYCD